MHCLFASMSFGLAFPLLAEIAAAFGADAQLETFRDVELFSERLSRHNGPGILILLAAEAGDLERLCENSEWLLQADVILLVPNDAPDTIAMAHSLRPRYLGMTDCDLDKVVPVLNHLLRKREQWRDRGNGTST